jgi:hypothetical protein
MKKHAKHFANEREAWWRAGPGRYRSLSELAEIVLETLKLRWERADAQD